MAAAMPALVALATSSSLADRYKSIPYAERYGTIDSHVVSAARVISKPYSDIELKILRELSAEF